MSNDRTRQEIGWLLADIERFTSALGLRHVEIINPAESPIRIIHDRDACEAWEIIDRIERKLFPAGMPR